MLITLAEIGLYFTFIGNVFKFEQPPEKLTVCLKKGSEWEKAHSPKELPTKTRSSDLHPPNLTQPPAHRIQSALFDLFSGYGSLIFTDQIASGTKNIENHALTHTKHNKTLPIPSYSSASRSVQYFYHSYAFMLNCIDFFSISSLSRPQESTL